MSQSTYRIRTAKPPVFWLPVLAGVALFLFVAGCDTAKAPDSFPNMAAAEAPTVLSAGDVLSFSFSGAPELNQAQRIRPDGKLTLPMIGEVTAEGKTIGAFQAELAEKYKPQLKNTEVLVSLQGSATRTIVVDGAVRNPGSIPCDRPLTAFEAVMLAGGFAPDAEMKKVQLIRVVNGQHRSVFIDMRPAMSGKPAPVVAVQAGDIIFVPDSYF